MQKLVEIRRFDNPVEAHVLVDLLTEAGIPARVFDEHVGTALPHYGLIGVRVVVRAEDVVRAAAVIAEERAARREAPEVTAEEIPWRDSGAGVGTEMSDPDDDGADADETGPREEEPGSSDDPAAEGAYAGASASMDVAGREADAIAWATRTRLFAFLGIACFFFSFGALFRAMDAPPDVATIPVARRRLRQARILAWCGIAAAGTFAVSLWFAFYFRARG